MGVKLDPCSTRPEPQSVLRARADCGGRLFSAKLGVVSHDCTHQLDQLPSLKKNRTLTPSRGATISAIRNRWVDRRLEFCRPQQSRQALSGSVPRPGVGGRESRPGRLISAILTCFRHFSERVLTMTGGDRGGGSAERAPRDGGNAPHSRHFALEQPRQLWHCKCGGRPSPIPQMPLGHRQPRTYLRGFSFLRLLAIALPRSRV